MGCWFLSLKTRRRRKIRACWTTQTWLGQWLTSKILKSQPRVNHASLRQRKKTLSCRDQSNSLQSRRIILGRRITWPLSRVQRRALQNQRRLSYSTNQMCKCRRLSRWKKMAWTGVSLTNLLMMKISQWETKRRRNQPRYPIQRLACSKSPTSQRGSQRRKRQIQEKGLRKTWRMLLRMPKCSRHPQRWD